MRKADIIQEIANKTGIPKVDILVTLEAFFQEVKQSVYEGEPVSIRGFGTFSTLLRKKKVGRNIKAKTSVEIPEHYIPKFKPAKEFVESVKNGKLK